MTQSLRRLITDSHGSVLLVAVLILMAASLVGGSIAYLAATDLEVSSNYENGWRAFYAADGGGRAAFGELVEMTRTMGRFPTDAELTTIAAPAITGMTYEDFLVHRLATPTERTLTAGFFHGLASNTGTFDVTTSARAGYIGAGESVSMGLDVNLIPVFQFAVFSDPDLALASPSPLTLAGRVHTNGDLFMGGPADVRIEGAVTAHGRFIRLGTDKVAPGVDAPPVDEARLEPVVKLRAGLDNVVDVRGDSDAADWADAALERYRGNLRSGEHGVPRLRLTIPNPDEPRQIIEPGLDTDTAEDRATKVFYHAGMSINVLNGQGFDAAGNRFSLGEAIGFDVLHDPREQKPMLMIEIDLEALADLPQYPADAASTVIYLGSFRPGNGLPEWDVERTSAAIKVSRKIQREAAKAAAEELKGLYGLLWRNATVILKELMQACAKDSIAEAGLLYGRFVDLFDELESAGGITLGEQNYLTTLSAPLETCDGRESNSVPWPDEWKGFDPPYAGGNTAFAVKLLNGDKLVNDLTVVTANPLYLHGDYNKKDPKAAALLADSLTVLSDDWEDEDKVYSQLPLEEREADGTELNAALLIGAGGVGGSGGVGNMIRFIEDWSGEDFVFTGSLVTLWRPRHSTGAYLYGAPVFRAPEQEWIFDVRLRDPANHPPATPTVHTLRMSYWRQR
jgi:hypothetical protein